MQRLFKIGSDRHDVGRVTFSWHPEGNFLASAGKNGIIHITDRHGDVIDEIPLSTSAPVLALEWDRDGEYLAVLQDGNGVVPLWNLSTKRIVPLETSLKDPTFIAWSKTGPQLVVGTAKGNILIYNKVRKQKIPIMGKHSKRINCGAWSSTGNKLVLGSDDRNLTVSNENGDTLIQTELKYSPLETYFAHSEDSKFNEDGVVSANLSGRSLLLYNILDEKEDPLELTFATKESGLGCKYGDLIRHFWFGENLMLIGFSEGYIICVSTNPKELGEERYSIRIHNDFLTNFSYNKTMKKLASAGNDGVRILDVVNFKEAKADYIPNDEVENGRITDLCWSPDGQILTVGTSSGNIYNFLAKKSSVHACYKSNVAYLTSLRQVSVVDAVKRSRPIDVTVKLEPSIISIGANHVAAGMNNRVYFHRISANDPNNSLVNEQEYVGIVKQIELNNDYAVVLTDTKAVLHTIEPNNSPDALNQSRTFPNREEGSYSKINTVALTDNILFYGTEGGTVELFFLLEWTLLSSAELKLDNPVKKIFPNSNGSKIVVVDGADQIFLYNPVSCGTGGTNSANSAVLKFEDAPTNILNILWDLEEKNIIIVVDNNYFLHTFLFVQTTIEGSKLFKLGPVTVSSIGEIAMKPDKVDISAGNIPILCASGSLVCQASNGNLVTILHPFFDLTRNTNTSKSQKLRKSNNNNYNDEEEAMRNEIFQKSNQFCHYLALNKLDKAFQIAMELNKRSFLLALSHKAMELLNVELAYRVYNQLGDAGMSMALFDCLYIEDIYSLSGNIALLFGNYGLAQELFLLSSNPIQALEMRKDLQQWEASLKLAYLLAPNQIPDICIQYGLQLEMRDEVEKALNIYEESMSTIDHDGNPVISDTSTSIARTGIARCHLRLGNLRQGIHMANQIDDKSLFLDCGNILETQKQYNEAASMYIKSEQYEKAGLIYTKYLIKNDKNKIAEIASIMEKVQNDALNSAYGKACVVAGRFDDAMKAFRRAKDFDKIVELQLKNLDQVQQAFDLVRQTSSSQGAQIIADYCLEQGDYRGMIEFLLIANKSEEAFKTAQAQNLMDIYTNLIGDNMSSDDALKVAGYYEKLQDFGRAGKFYSICGQYSRALKLYLQCGDRELNAAIEVVGKSQNDSLTRQLIDYLVGEKDGVPKDSNYIYRLYIALKKYEDAAKTAMIIARQEQDLGNYLAAHAIAVETIRQLEDSGIKVPLQMRTNFILLHSYQLIKYHIKINDHMGAARLLLRIVTNLSKFPLHQVPLLTSTVIECQRAGLKAASYEYAVMLVRPEYRSLISDVNIKRKIEAIVRRKSTALEGGDPVEESSPCPISSQPIPTFSLECPTTHDALPMCIITGKHMVLNDWCFCPISKFPALYSEYCAYINREIQVQLPEGKEIDDTFRSSMSAADPIFGKSVSISDLVLIPPDDALKYIQRYNNVFEKPKEDKDAEEDGAEGDKAKDGDEATEGEENTDKKQKKSKSSSKTNPNRAKLERIHRSRKRRHNR